MLPRLKLKNKNVPGFVTFYLKCLKTNVSFKQVDLKIKFEYFIHGCKQNINK